MWGFESVTPRLIHGLCGNTKLNFSIKTDPSRSEWRQRNMSGCCAHTRISGTGTRHIMHILYNGLDFYAEIQICFGIWCHTTPSYACHTLLWKIKTNFEMRHAVREDKRLCLCSRALRVAEGGEGSHE